MGLFRERSSDEGGEMTKVFRELLRRLPASALLPALCALGGCRDVPTQRSSGELGGAVEEARVPGSAIPNPSETSTTPDNVAEQVSQVIPDDPGPVPTDILDA